MPTRAKDAVLCVTTQRHSAHTFPRGKPAGFFPIIKIPDEHLCSLPSRQGFQKPPVTETQRGTRRDGQAPALTAQALADYKLLETKH